MKVKVIGFYGFSSTDFSEDLEVGYCSRGFRSVHFSTGDLELSNRKMNRKMMSDYEDPEAAINGYKKSLPKTLTDSNIPHRTWA